MNHVFIQHQWSEPKPLKLHPEPASSQVTVSILSYHNLEVVAGNDHLSVLHPADGGLRVSRHGTLHFDVRAFIRVHVRRVVEKLRRHWGQRENNMINIIWTTTETTSQTRTDPRGWRIIDDSFSQTSIQTESRKHQTLQESVVIWAVHWMYDAACVERFTARTLPM